MKTKLLLLFLLFLSTKSFATNIVVTNTNDSGAGSFRAAVTGAAMSDTIRFDLSLIATESDTITLLTPISITKGIFIKGLYNSTDTLFISGGGVSSLFAVSMANGQMNPNVELDSLVCINGYSTEGGVLKYTSNHNANAILYIKNCVFRNNSATRGGVFFGKRETGLGSYTMNLFISNSTFKSNQATIEGGVVYAYYYSPSSSAGTPKLNMTATDCNFLNNSATSVSSGKGGVVFAYANHYQSATSAGICDITLTRSTIDGSYAGIRGGAISIQTTDSYSNTDSESKIVCNYSTISNNYSTDGGAFYVLSSNTSQVDLFYSTVVNNTALEDGAAFYIHSTGSTNTYGNTARLNLKSSILALNGGNISYQNTVYQNGNHHQAFSENNNIFDFLTSHFQYYTNFIAGTNPDVFSATAAQINLGPLALNPNGTYTRIPNATSIAVNNGLGTHTLDAQNGPIMGVRDVGAAESPVCEAVPVSESASVCQGSTYDFYGQSLTTAGSYQHTITTPNACDTLITLTLTVQNPVTPSVTIVATPGNTIMTGTTVNLTATPVNGGSSPSYQWMVNGSNTGPNAPSISTSGFSNGDAIKCIMTSSNTCVTANDDESNTITFTVHANNDEPCNGIALDVNSTCVTEYFANHIATSTPNVGPHSCAASTSKDIWFTFIAPPSGTVEIYTYAGTLTDAVMTIYQGPNCSSLFDVGCIDDDGSNQMPQGLVSAATPGTEYYIRVSSYGTTASGNFGICVVDPGTSSLFENADEAGFEVYPNPNTGVFQVKFKTNELRGLKLFSPLGALVYSGETNSNEFTVDTGVLASGVYLLEVNESGKISQRKVIIQ